MSLTSLSNIVGPSGEALQETSRDTYRHLRRQTGDFISEASTCIRKHPVPIVAGAIVLGIAVGYILMTCNGDDITEENLADHATEPLAEAGDAIATSARRLFDNLKFW